MKIVRNCVDVIVAGAGPAGCSAAIMLAKAGLRVEVIDLALKPKEHFGETLPPSAFSLLDELGIQERFSKQNHLPLLSFQTSWGNDSLFENDFSFHPYEAWRQLDRRSFDLMLRDVCVQSEVIIHTGARFKSFAKENGCDNAYNWDVVFVDEFVRHQRRASFVIDATGRTSFVSRRQGAVRQKFDSLIGLTGLFAPNSENTNLELSFLLEAVNLGWICSTQTHDRKIAAICMTDLDLIPRSRKLLSSFYLKLIFSSRYNRHRLKNYTTENLPRLLVANTAKLNQVFGDGWIAIGDAAFSFDPLSSQGVSNALTSSISGAQAVIAFLAGNKKALNNYANEMKEIFDGYLRKRNEFYKREHRWASSPFWYRRQNIKQNCY